MRCEITLRPVWHADAVASMDVKYAFDALEIGAGEELCRFQLRTVSIPGCEPENLRAADAAGDVPLSAADSAPYPYELRHFTAQRAVSGAVKVEYTVRPRVLEPEAICGPYFDLRAEEGGANSAGISFLAAFEGCAGDISLRWDMSEMPEGSIGVCPFGEGDVSYTGALDTLRNSYFAFGRVKCLTEGEFGFYWLTEPYFDMPGIAAYTRSLFAVMQRFFSDTDPTYRIFVRKDPFLTSGGTALHRSYMFGWNDHQPVSVEAKQTLLAHEMVHNWPRLNDAPYGRTTWYAEGTAEFYSLMLPLRAGLMTPAAALRELQQRTDNYYTNPTRHMENEAAAKICWQDRRAQRIAYGRGFIFLGNVDVMMRRATGGRRSIDDVVLRVLEIDRAGGELGNELFLSLVKEYSGLDVTAEWEAMRTGEHIVPMEDSFDGLFTVREKTIPEADTGAMVTSYEWSLRNKGDA
ncbi:MAG: hypothetical protein IJZ74_09480 [Clostridia bacterium]|nr:hypothetical protein [Clostridia bacterium]